MPKPSPPAESSTQSSAPSALRQPADAVLHAYQRFTARDIRRSQIKNAEYNPRVITADARRKLRKGIEKRGLIGTLTWNERTGNLVGGHQRLKVLDALSETSDYLLTVAVVDLTDVEEKERNALLNNTAAQGDFDLEKLEEMIRTDGFNVGAAGWDEADVYRLFGESPAIQATAAKENVQAAIDRIMALENSTDAAKAAALARDREDFYLVVVFRSYDERKAFTDARGLEDNRYQAGDGFGAVSRPAPAA